MKQISKGDGESTVFSAYSSSVINLNNNWDTSLGVTAQYFTLNNNLSIEPQGCPKMENKSRNILWRWPMDYIVAGKSWIIIL